MKKQTKIIYLFLVLAASLQGCQENEFLQEENKSEPVLKAKATQKTVYANEDVFLTITGDEFPWSSWQEYREGRRRGLMIANKKMAETGYTPVLRLSMMWRKPDISKPGGLGEEVPRPSGIFVGEDAERPVQTWKVGPDGVFSSYIYSQGNSTTRQQLYEYYTQTPTAYWAGAYDSYIDMVYYNNSWY